MSDPTPLHSVAYGQPEQLEFEGLPVAMTRFALESVARLATDKILAYNTHVEGTFSGRVKGISFVEDADGSLIRVHFVEVLDADLV